MSGLRQFLKQVGERLLGSELAVSAGLGRRRGARLILSYHNVVSDAVPPLLGDRSLHLPLRNFREQLDALNELGIRVVPLASTTTPASAGPPEVVLTFDDAYAGALQHAIPELAARGIPATIFVAPGLLGAPAPWWDLLADPAEGAVPEPIRIEALTRYHGEGQLILNHAAASGWALHPPASEHRICSEEELRAAMARHAGLTLGTHTWSHPNLAALVALDEEQARTQLVATAAWLQERFGERAIGYVAYPYGLESPAVRRIAALAGFTGGLRVSGGWDNRRGDPFGIPRLNVTAGLSQRGFRVRLAALSGSR
jgi:peptidoglycan/xylan/chitin deacetylase (PgdA/CDA1 family)